VQHTLGVTAQRQFLAVHPIHQDALSVFCSY
jgi:hypothetical protein